MSEEIKYGTTGKPHPFHIVEPSPWPLVGSISGAVTAYGAATYFHGSTWYIMALGLFGILLTMWMWWRDVIDEAVRQRAHTAVVKFGMRYGMLLFIASEMMFFFAFFWAYFHVSLFPNDAIGGVWPPAGIHTISPFDLPFLMTMILLLSGCTVTWAHHALLENNQRDLVRGLGLTVFLGVFFSGFQVYEYVHSHFGFTDTVYASTFYIATGFHGLHVLIGTIFLAVCFFRAKKGHFTPNDHFGFEAAAWYWHFVDVVWLFLFVAIYWYGGH